MEREKLEKLKKLALDVMEESKRIRKSAPPTTFKLFDEEFDIVHFPKVYKIYKHDPEWAEIQIKSISDVWHEGDITSATIALESDLGHG